MIAASVAALFLVITPLHADTNDIQISNSSGFTGHNVTCGTGCTTASFTPGSSGASNRYMLVVLSIGKNVASNSVSFAGTTLNQIGFKTDTHQYIYMYEWPNWTTNPLPTTAGTFVITLANNTQIDLALSAAVFTNVGSHGTVLTANGQSQTNGTGEPSIAVPTGDRHVIVDAVNANAGTTTLTSTTTNSDGNSAVIIQNIDTNTNGGGGAEANLAESAEEGGTTSPVTMSWLLTKTGANVKDTWIMLAVDLVYTTTPTVINLGDFTADRCGTTTTLNWNTAFEARNLGFHLYREVNGERTRVTPALIAGSALFATSGKLANGRPYAWNDATNEGATYWLEEIDTHGVHTMHGPALIRDDCSHATSSPSRLVTGPNPAENKGQVVITRQPASPIAASSLALTTSSRRHATTPPSGVDTMKVQQAIAAGPAVKLTVAAPGWYRVTGAELIASRIDPNVDPRNLQLFLDGRQQAMTVAGESDGKLDTADSIEFFGNGTDTYWTDARIYWLIDGKSRGDRIHVDPVAPPFAPLSGTFRMTVQRKDRNSYYAELTQGDGENFYGSAFGSDPVNETISLRHIETSAPEANVEVTVVGLSAIDTLNPDHFVNVQLNGTMIGTFSFDGFTRGIGRFNVSPTLLREGDNTITLSTTGGADDFSSVTSVSITYSHTFAPDNDSLFFSVASGNSVTLSGFTTTAVRMFDITDPATPRELATTVQTSGGVIAATATLAGTGTRQLLAVTNEKLLHPRAITANTPSNIHAATNRGSYLMIANHALVSSLAPLKPVREADGFTVATIDLDDIYDEYSFGTKDPAAIKHFLLDARNWQLAPKYVLLAGDASFDPRNYLGFGDVDLLPSHFISTEQIETMSDDWFVDFDNDGIPDLPIGRFAARDPQQLANMVSKTVNYTQSGSSENWTKQAVIVADANDPTFDFERAATRVAALLPSTITPTIDRLSSGLTSSQLESQITSGALVVEYIGHGSVAQWSDRSIFTGSQAAAVKNGTHTPLVIAMTCLNALFQDVYTTSMAESFMNNTGGGAVAVWASSSLTPPGGQEQMGESLVRNLFSASKPTIGEAMRLAKQQTTSADVRASWVLLGDPALKLK